MKLNILHLDNDAEYATDLTLKLLALGLTTDHTTLEMEAIELTLDQKYEVLICEMDLNILPGPSLIRAVKAMNPALEVIVISKRGDIKGMEEVFAAGGSEYLVKELTDHKIVDIISQLLALRLNQNLNKR